MSEKLVLAFRLAEAEANRPRHAFPEAAHAVLEEAARALLADAAKRHHVEERASVWLRLDDNGRWTIDSPTNDGYPLQGYDDGPVNTECEHGDDLDDECSAVRDAAQHIELPTLPELLPVIQDYLGVTA